MTMWILFGSLVPSPAGRPKSQGTSHPFAVAAAALLWACIPYAALGAGFEFNFNKYSTNPSSNRDKTQFSCGTYFSGLDNGNCQWDKGDFGGSYTDDTPYRLETVSIGGFTYWHQVVGDST